MDKILCPTFWKYLNCFSFQIEREGYFIGGPVAPTLNIMANSNRTTIPRNRIPKIRRTISRSENVKVRNIMAVV